MSKRERSQADTTWLQNQPRLWEVDHPYYCEEGNYYASPLEGLHAAYDSWAEFYEDWGDSDPDMNLVFRWDWKRYDPDEWMDDATPGDRLYVYWVLQRKAILRSTECIVTGEDEPAVCAWLATRAQAIREIWAPLLLPGEERMDPEGEQASRGAVSLTESRLLERERIAKMVEDRRPPKPERSFNLSPRRERDLAIWHELTGIASIIRRNSDA